MQVNPFKAVEPTIYRLRLLNGANARFFSLSFSVSTANQSMPSTNQSMPAANQSMPSASQSLTFYQIASDAAFLPAPVALTQLVLSPGERVEVLVDFSQVPAGASVILMNAGFDINSMTGTGGMGGMSEELSPSLQMLVRFDVSQSGGGASGKGMGSSMVGRATMENMPGMGMNDTGANSSTGGGNNTMIPKTLVPWLLSIPNSRARQGLSPLRRARSPLLQGTSTSPSCWRGFDPPTP